MQGARNKKNSPRDGICSRELAESAQPARSSRSVCPVTFVVVLLCINSLLQGCTTHSVMSSTSIRHALRREPGSSTRHKGACSPLP
jgi:hypothetical protein